MFAVAAGDSHTVGLRTDGHRDCGWPGFFWKVRVRKLEKYHRRSSWYGSHVGPVSGRHRFGCGGRAFLVPARLVKWNHITFIAAGHIHTIGINQMGRIQEADGFAAPGVMDWSDISRVAVSPFHTVGLKKDGTLFQIRIYNVGKTHSRHLVSHPNRGGTLA